MYTIFVINPGSTSTKIALYRDDHEEMAENLHHSPEQLTPHSQILGQFDFRRQTLLRFMQSANLAPDSVDAYVGRGGLLHPIPSGTYEVDHDMVEDLRHGVMGEHASNLGGLLAHALAQSSGARAFIVDPVVVDEMDNIARLSGHPDLPRKSIFHALNHKAVARKAASHLGKSYPEINLIVAHLGGGISIAAHRRGRVIDVNNALDGEGAFTPERSGTLPAGDLVRLCFSGRYSKEKILRMIKGGGGVMAYLGVNDMRVVADQVRAGDERARRVYQGMAYQVSKEIAALGAVLKGQVDMIVLTGGVAYDSTFVEWIEARCSFLAPVIVHPGEEEMEALALGALRVLRNDESARTYSKLKAESYRRMVKT